MYQEAKYLYEFGPFRLDPHDRLLWRGDQHVSLTPKAFETLLVLVESGGRVVEKDELLKKVWPDTFVEEVNLAKNVSFLRKILGGDNHDEFIETIPKRGYRFAAIVREVAQERSGPLRMVAPAEYPLEDADGARDQAQSNSVPQAVLSEKVVAAGDHSTRSRTLRRMGWVAASLLAGTIVSLLLWILVLRPEAPKTPVSVKVLPFTSFPGAEGHAAFSTNGNQLAFVWGGERDDNPDIYVRLVGAGKPLRLTTDPAADTHPAWSPDGRYVAFFRQTAESCGLFLVPALGGAEQKIADVFPYRTPAPGNSEYFAPDGQSLVIADKSTAEEPLSLFSVSIGVGGTGVKRRITVPPAGTVGDSYPSFSPDGKMLAFVRTSSQATNDLHLVSVSGVGTPRRLTFDNAAIQGLAWTPDGKQLVFSSRRQSSIYQLWRIGISGGTPERIASIGQSVISPAVARVGNRLAYSQSLDDSNIWRLELQASGRATGLTSLISSTLDDDGPSYSPDGQKIAFASNRSGAFGIWICDSDGANPTLLVERGSNLTGTPRWSPDGAWIAFDARSSESGRAGDADIYLMKADGGEPRRLTSEASEDVVPSWSQDSRWIYFGSTRSGSMQIWKLPVDGGEAMQLTKDGGFEGFESKDGQTFYYAKGRGLPGIWKVPATGGVETLLFDHHQAGYWRLWSVVEKGIFFATHNEPARPMIEFFSFSQRTVSPVALLDKPLARLDPGLTISPDGRWLLFTQMDQSGSDIMLVEDFN